MPGRLHWDPRVPPPLPERLPFRDPCSRSSLPLVGPSESQRGLCAGEVFPQLMVALLSCFRLRGVLPGKREGQPNSGFGDRAQPLSSLDAADLRGVCGFPPLRSPRAGGTVLAVVSMVTAASLRGTSVVAEQPLENCVFAVETWSLLSPGLFSFSSLHTLQYTSFSISPSPEHCSSTDGWM